MTRKELNRIRSQVNTVKTGYCNFSNLPYKEKAKYIEIGSNYGVYGWNWTAYLNTNNSILIIDGYRNF